jgi:hypothetical protein
MGTLTVWADMRRHDIAKTAAMNASKALEARFCSVVMTFRSFPKGQIHRVPFESSSNYHPGQGANSRQLQLATTALPSNQRMQPIRANLRFSQAKCILKS